MRSSIKMTLSPIVILAAAVQAGAGTTLYVDGSNPNCPGSGSAGDPFCSVQDGIVAATDGDTVLVAPGAYFESIDFLGKAITVTSEVGPAGTFIDALGLGTVVTFQTGEGPSSVLEGFTVQGGSADTGGGVLCDRTAPILRENVVTGNTAVQGAGIACIESSALIEGNVITGNDASDTGGGISSVVGFPSGPFDADVTIVDNWIDGNTAAFAGGGIFVDGSLATITNNLVSRNTFRGISIWNYGSAYVFQSTLTENFPVALDVAISSATITNSILWNNGWSISDPYSHVKAGHSLIEFGWWSSDPVLDTDPLFVDPAGDDFHLGPGSPGIDAGTKRVSLPVFDLDGRRRSIDGDLDGVRKPDLGAFEFALQPIRPR